jgi:cytochrome c oxidase subunit 4
MSDHGHGDGHHIVGPATYFKNLMFLMGMMVLTVVASWYHIGPADSQALNLIVAMLIALCKMTAILLIFMHVKYSSGLVRLFAFVAFGFLIIMFSFTFADVVARKNGYHSTFVPDPYGGKPAHFNH